MNMSFQISETFNIYKDWINQYYKIIDELDVNTAKVLEALSRKNTINFSSVAKDLNMPVSTVHNIITRLRKKNLLYINTYIDVTALGLKPHAVILYPTTSQNAMKVLNAIRKYRAYLAKGYLSKPCIYVKYMIPNGREQDFIEFLNTALQLNLISDYELYPTTMHYNPHLSFKNFDFQNKTWIFNWNEFLSEINTLPPTPSKYLIWTGMNTLNKFDHVDLKILWRLEVNALASLSSVQKSLGDITFQAVYYHYINHILKRNIIVGFNFALIPFPYTINNRIITDSIIIFATFKDQEWMLKFANALNNKIFIRSISRVLSENTLVFSAFLPHTEVPEFLNVLNTLMDREIITSYKYAWLDVRTAKRESLPYSQYDTETGTWKWHQEEYLLKLQEPLTVNVP